MMVTETVELTHRAGLTYNVLYDKVKTSQEYRNDEIAITPPVAIQVVLGVHEKVLQYTTR